ncbi:MAG: biotin-dependent carboxyltransferase family protein [Pseudidiomarina maritima]|nr:biotin-dependent carboxyltransferase family protein [Pseudidiomarina maritima]
MSLRILQSGPLTTLQDFGRFGYLHQGISVGGPLDERAFLWANRLLNNHFNAAQLEITLGGFRAEFTAATAWVVTGAELPMSLNGQPVPAQQVQLAAAGDVLTVAPGGVGLRAYLAVAGGFIATPVYGSVATVVRDGLGGLQQQGQAVQSGDRIAYATVPGYRTLLGRRPGRTVAPQLPTAATGARDKPVILEVMASGQYAQFEPAQQQLFMDQLYQVTPAQDRMGVRLAAAEPLQWSQAQIISEPLPVGAVQIPPNGQPIVMLKDRQTLGGYPKLATLTWRAQNTLAQLPAASEIQFRWVSATAAARHLQQVYQFFQVQR